MPLWCYPYDFINYTCILSHRRQTVIKFFKMQIQFSKWTNRVTKHKSLNYIDHVTINELFKCRITIKSIMHDSEVEMRNGTDLTAGAHTQLTTGNRSMGARKCRSDYAKKKTTKVSERSIKWLHRQTSFLSVFLRLHFGTFILFDCGHNASMRSVPSATHTNEIRLQSWSLIARVARVWVGKFEFFMRFTHWLITRN